MPRKRTHSGAPAQAPVPPVDVPYGEGERMVESQRRTPVPLASGAGPAGAGSPSPAPGGGSRTTLPNDPAQRLAMAVQAMRGMTPPAGLDAPSQRPNEPFTTGLDVGPGAGPEILRPGDHVLRTLQTLASMHDNPGFRHLAEQAALVSTIV